MHETLDSVFSSGIEQHACADDICVNEILGRIDAAIDMRLGREIDYRKKLVLEHKPVYRVGVGNVGFEKFVTLAMFLDHAREIGRITGISEHIDIGHEGRLVMLQNVANKIAPDESAATGHENSHSKS